MAAKPEDVDFTEINVTMQPQYDNEVHDKGTALPKQDNELESCQKGKEQGHSVNKYRLADNEEFIYDNICIDQLSSQKTKNDHKLTPGDCFRSFITRCLECLSKSMASHWKVWIAVFVSLTAVLFIVVIILISLLRGGSNNSSDKTGTSLATKQILCKYHPCLNNGKCIEGDNTILCTCKEGFFGKYCQFTPCTQYYCLNNGSCVVSNSTGTCSCLSGYTGAHCEVTPCTNILCQNGGSCQVQGSHFTCFCPEGTSGEFCEGTPCSLANKCLNGGSCLFTSTIAACACPFEYYGEACEKSCQYGAQYHLCTFEDGEGNNCFLQNDASNDIEWTRYSGPTPSKNTGPIAASEGQFYIYMESSPPAEEKHVARLISKQRISGCTRCLRFSYYMYGLAVGTLNIYHDVSIVWTRSGDQGNMWNIAIIRIDEAVNTSIIIEAVRGNGITGDIAIDNIQLTPGACI